MVEVLKINTSALGVPLLLDNSLKIPNWFQPEDPKRELYKICRNF